MEFLQLQYIDKVVDVALHVLQFSSADVEETADLPQLHLVAFWTVVACPLCATTGAVWLMTWRSSSTVMDVAVIMQRRLRQWKCSVFSLSLELVDIFVRNRAVGMVAAMRGGLLQFPWLNAHREPL